MKATLSILVAFVLLPALIAEKKPDAISEQPAKTTEPTAVQKNAKAKERPTVDLEKELEKFPVAVQKKTTRTRPGITISWEPAIPKKTKATEYMPIPGVRGPDLARPKSVRASSKKKSFRHNATAQKKLNARASVSPEYYSKFKKPTVVQSSLDASPAKRTKLKTRRINARAEARARRNAKTSPQYGDKFKQPTVVQSSLDASPAKRTKLKTRRVNARAETRARRNAKTSPQYRDKFKKPTMVPPSEKASPAFDTKYKTTRVTPEAQKRVDKKPKVSPEYYNKYKNRTASTR